jgi:iron(III) transport system ATP-binding protein
MSSFLSVQAVHAALGSMKVLEGVEFDLREGECLSILGSSGSGKTTLLRVIAGLAQASRGSIRLSGRVLFDSDQGVSVPCHQRKVGVVFQDLALFPHLSVSENIQYGIAHLSVQSQKQRCDEVLKLVGLKSLENRMPHEISGGQQQRVALARALAPRPELILFDEPFSSLDQALRRDLSLEVRDVLKTAGTSAIFVSHDLDEAFDFGDEIALLDSGQILQRDRALEIYRFPQSIRAACALSEVNSLKVLKQDGQSVCLEGALMWESPVPLPPGITHWLLRPEELVIDLENRGWPVQAGRRLFRRSGCLVEVRFAHGKSALVWDERGDTVFSSVIPSPRTLKFADSLGKVWSSA